jgi:gamma-glutamylcyclotransferase (GGCT)/AIG2-like uncharacterized protein YtfP
MGTHLVFVYGSLKQNFGNHHCLETATFVEATRTAARSFRMESMGGFPAVLKNGSYAIEGELYEVSDKTLERLDRLESNGHFYERELVFLASGHTAWMYLLMSNGAAFRFGDNGRVKNTRNHTQSWLPERVYFIFSEYQSPKRDGTLA